MKKALPLIIGVAMIIIGWQLWDKNEGSSLKDKEGYYKKICEEGVKTMATLQNEYSQMKGKIVNIVTYKYDYVVNGKTYTGQSTTNKLPDNNEFEVTYLPDSPEVVERGKPCATYESIKNDNSSPFLQYLGIGLFFIGIAVGWNGLKTLIKSK
jgi:hypothetical protein